MKFQKIARILKIYTKIHFFIKKKPSKNTLWIHQKKWKITFSLYFQELLQKSTRNATKKRIYKKTQYVKSNKLKPAKTIVHLRCRGCRRHLEGLPLTDTEGNVLISYKTWKIMNIRPIIEHCHCNVKVAATLKYK